jgi:hypothetical protein
MRAADLAW